MLLLAIATLAQLQEPPQVSLGRLYDYCLEREAREGALSERPTSDIIDDAYLACQGQRKAYREAVLGDSPSVSDLRTLDAFMQSMADARRASLRRIVVEEATYH